MSSISGKLTKERFGPVVPVHASAYQIAPTMHFTDVDVLTFTYRTDPEVVAEILPAPLEIDENVAGSVTFVSYGVTGVGAYREAVHQVHCRLHGAEVGYVAHIVVTNEPAMLAGREWLGFPKVLGDVEFDARRQTTDGLITASVERPAGVPLATGLFRPGDFLGDLPEPPVSYTHINLKVIPSAVAGRPPAVAELVPTTMTMLSGRMWTGTGSVRFTGASEFDPMHRIPVVESLGATLVTGATLRLTAPDETYPL
jgi:acetoacetate decarboxylase